MDKKKLSSGLKISAFFLALLSIFTWFGGAIKYTISDPTNAYARNVDSWSIFDYTFKKGFLAENSGVHYNAIYIVGFALALIAIVGLATVLVTKLIGKEKVQLTKGAIIVAIIAFVYIAAIAFAMRGVFQGELYKDPDMKPERIPEIMKQIKLGSGSICSGIFGILGAGSLVGALVLDKKN